MIAAAVTVAVILAAILIAGYYMYRFAVVRRDGGPNDTPWHSGEAFPRTEYVNDENYLRMNSEAEYVRELFRTTGKSYSMTSRDGLKLAARYIPAPDGQKPRGIFLMSHGYRSTSIYDFACAVRYAHERGFGCFMIDQRAAGASEGRYIGFALLERYDLVDWCGLIGREFPGVPVIPYGVSMGSATVMMAAGVGYPENVRALICDCGYTRASDICKLSLKRWFKLPPFPIYYVAELLVRLRAGYLLGETSSSEALRKNKLPILFAHGRPDTFVPYYMSEENYASAGSELPANEQPYKAFFTSETADHGMALPEEGDRYWSEVDRLLDIAGI